jgi:hypothetical protein
MESPALVRSVEQFHLLLLAQLARRVNPSLFVVKGGCNLRFFYKSIRYSADMDLDVGGIGVGPFRDRVRQVFGSRPFAQILEARGLSVDRVTEPKQTETTQRWKIGLRAAGAPSTSIPTKIECSRRGVEDGVVIGGVDPLLARAYQLPPLMLAHYDAPTALRQKVGALAGRRETQARDVFDLHHLFATGATLRTPRELSGEAVEQACANALTVDFGMFRSQVLAYLDLEERSQYDSAAVWDAVVLGVVEALRAASP